MTIDYDTLLDAVLGADLDEGAIRKDYSGRGMYGNRCFGIVYDSPGQLLQVAALLGSDYADLFRVTCEDNMGRSMIAYFPGWTLGADEDA